LKGCVERLKALFADGLPHFAGELGDPAGGVNALMLWRSGYLMRSEQTLSFNRLMVRGGSARWRPVRGYLYVLASSGLKSDGAMEYSYKRTMEHTHEEKEEKVVLRFEAYQPGKRGSLWQVKLTKDEFVEWLKKRGMGCSVKDVAEGFGVLPTRASNFLRSLLRKGVLVARGQWNPGLGRETMFRGRVHGMVYGLTAEDCDRYIRVEGAVLTDNARAILREVEKNSLEKRFTPLWIFGRYPYKMPSSDVVYSSQLLARMDPGIVKKLIGGSVFMFEKKHFMDEDVAAQEKYWSTIISDKKSRGTKIGSLHESVGQVGIDEMARELRVEWKFWRVVREGRINYNVRLSNGREIDRILEIKYSPFGFTQLFPIECKFVRGGMTKAQVAKHYRILATSFEFGADLEGEAGEKTRVIRGNVSPVIITPKMQPEAQKYANRLGMIVIPTWRLTNFISEKAGRKITMKKLIKQLLGSPDRGVDKLMAGEVLAYLPGKKNVA